MSNEVTQQLKKASYIVSRQAEFEFLVGTLSFRIDEI
jgi:hypothetical protein